MVDHEGPSQKRGRRALVIAEDYIRVVLEHKDRIVHNGKIVPATHSVWKDASLSLEGRVKANTLYTSTVSNRYNLLALLGLCEGAALDDNSCDSSHDHDISSSTEDIGSLIQITFSKAEFDELVTETISAVKKDNKTYLRKYTVLKQDKWTEVIAKKLYEKDKLRHGFHFKKHYIFRDGSGGSCEGNVLHSLIKL